MNDTAQAGAIAVRIDGFRPRVLLVTPKTERKKWIFPKGHVETGEDPSATAIRELLEESGVVGKVLRPADHPLCFISKGEHVEVQYLLVEYTGQVPS